MRLQAQLQEFAVRRVVVMVFLLHPRVLNVVDLYGEPELRRLSADQFRQLEDSEALGKLVEYAVFTRLRRIVDGQFHASQSVPDVQETAPLTSLPVHRKRHFD